MHQIRDYQNLFSDRNKNKSICNDFGVEEAVNIKTLLKTFILTLLKNKILILRTIQSCFVDFWNLNLNKLPDFWTPNFNKLPDFWNPNYSKLPDFWNQITANSRTSGTQITTNSRNSGTQITTNSLTFGTQIITSDFWNQITKLNKILESAL